MNSLVLAFDLDHTLFEVHLESDEVSSLSSSAKFCLSSSSDGIVSNPILKTDIATGEDYRAHVVRALNKDEMAAIFKKLVRTQIHFEQKKELCPISVVIITTATYDKKYVLQLLDKFYFSGKHVLQDETILPIDYYNLGDIDDYTSSPATEHFKTKSGLIEHGKERLITRLYDGLCVKTPTMDKKRVVLLDNADYHIGAVCSQGFTGLHYPTTPKDRCEGITFSEIGKRTVQELHRLVDAIAPPNPVYTVTRLSKTKVLIRRY